MGEAGCDGGRGGKDPLRRENTISPQAVKPTIIESSPRQQTIFSNRSLDISDE